jgi:hypothetical protein
MLHAALFHADGVLAKDNEEFAVDARRTPGGIFNDRSKDQVPDLLGDSLPADLPSLCRAWPNTIGIRPDASGPRFLVRPEEARLST